MLSGLNVFWDSDDYTIIMLIQSAETDDGDGVAQAAALEWGVGARMLPVGRAVARGGCPQ